jgi:hypothetical protein
VTEEPEAITMCKEIPVIPVNKLVDKKRIIGERELRRKEKCMRR